MPAPPTAAQIREVNVRYHDAAAGEYDGKWGIAFGPTGQSQVLGKLRKALGAGAELPVFQRGLEIGAGTGYFTLNLMLAGVLREAVCTDISPGMLAALEANAAELGLEVETVAGDAERLALPDGSFDLVFGHAVLHHLPDLQRAFGEFHRVLRPGGTLAFAGEPSRYGDRLAALPKRGAVTLAPIWRRLMGAGPAAPDHAHVHGNGHPVGGDHGMEFFVDVHAFAPADLRRHALAAGFEAPRVTGEELLASWFGWANRTLEGTADPGDVPWLWRQYAYRGYLLLQQVDRRLLEGRLPPEAFYNLMLAARRPA
jgi:SAM-dependent methyltransferase